LCMGKPMNIKCAHSIKFRGGLIKSNFHLTSEPFPADVERS